MQLVPSVLVIDGDARMRRLVRTALEMDGREVVEADTLGQARSLLAEPLVGVVVGHVPDDRAADLLSEVRRWCPNARIVLHGIPGGVDIEDADCVATGDLAALVDALRPKIRGAPGQYPAAVAARRDADVLHQTWRQLCRWDPALPPDAEPPIAESMIAAVAAALERPQPLGWGLDPALEPVAESFALNVEKAESALAYLVCLREAFGREVIPALRPEDHEEAGQRLNMIFGRIMITATAFLTRRLEEQALTDGLTGLGNRRAFERDLDRELSRVDRHGGTVTVAVIDLDGLKAINDRDGHAAGDEALRSIATALVSAARREDRAYRVGGDEFALLLVEADAPDEAMLIARLRSAGAPACSLGVATTPPEAADRLFRVADLRLYEGRQRRRTAGGRSGLA